MIQIFPYGKSIRALGSLNGPLLFIAQAIAKKCNIKLVL